MIQDAFLSISYAGPILYYAILARNKNISIEQHENFPKQSIRNRCEIFGANGKIILSIPVIRGRTHKVKIRDLKISYETDWQKQHFKSIESAYRHSPFYDYYIDLIQEFYIKKYKYLWDLDIIMMENIIEVLDLDLSIIFTEEFYTLELDKQDYRYENLEVGILDNKQIRFPKYYQVFENKHSFIPNLSIIDLLFNEGPGSLDYLLNVNI